MSRAKTTVYIDPGVLRAAKVAAARTGRKEYEIFEDALRRYLGLEVLDRVWQRGGLTEREAMRLAYRELRASRR